MRTDGLWKDLEITLIASPDDPSLDSESYQRDLRSFEADLRSHGLSPSSRVLLIESTGNEVAPHLGVFAVGLKEALPVIGSVLTGWFAGRFGRKIRVKVGEIEVEANTVAEAEKLIAAAEKIIEKDATLNRKL
jgi:hypothetical protein